MKRTTYSGEGPGVGGGGVLPRLMETCGQPGYVFRHFCLKPGIDFIIFCLNQDIDFVIFCLKRVSFLGRKMGKIFTRSFRLNVYQGIKNRNSVLNRVGKSVIFVLNRVRV